MITNETTIEETSLGWRIAQTGVEYETAGAAYKAAKKRDRALSTATGATVLTALHWQPTTRLGREVVRELATCS